MIDREVVSRNLHFVPEIGQRVLLVGPKLRSATVVGWRRNGPYHPRLVVAVDGDERPTRRIDIDFGFAYLFVVQDPAVEAPGRR